jgi:oligosaccharide repeat unit polymerase
MMPLIAANAIIFTAILVGIHRRLSPFSPFMLSALAWQVAFASGLVFGQKFYPLTEQAFLMWLVWFVVSGTLYLLGSDRPHTPGMATLRRLPIDYAPLIVVLILWLAYKIMVVGSASPTQFFYNLRASSNQTMYHESLGLIGRFYPWVFALFLFELINARAANRNLRLLLWCWMLLYALATMGKFAFLTPVLAWAVIKGIRGDLPLRKLVLLLPAMFGVMVVLHLIRSTTIEPFRFSEFLSIYTYSPIVAFGYMNVPPDPPFGANVLRFVYALLHALIGSAEPVPVIQEFVAVPYDTNVYTAMQPFYLDFGAAGVLLGATLYGLIFGLTYHQARANRQLPLMIYAGLSAVLVGQFIGDLLFMMFSGNLQFLLASIIYTSESRSVHLDG